MPSTSKYGPKFKYTERDMEAAYFAVLDGMSLKGAAIKHKVPRTTLRDHVIKKNPGASKLGRNPTLTSEEEQTIVDWIKDCCKRDLPPRRKDVLSIIKNMLKTSPQRDGLFVNGQPSKAWFRGFLRRHSDIFFCSRKRQFRIQTCLTEKIIRKWFVDLKINLREAHAADIMLDPSRIYNAHVINMELCPQMGKVIDVNNWKNNNEVLLEPDKPTISFLGTFSARGDIVTPALIYPFNWIPKDIFGTVPDNFFIGASDSGRVSANAFLEFLSNAFIPWLEENDVKKPVIFFIDEITVNLTIQASTLGIDNGIILYLLPTNATNILQPVTVGPLKTLRNNWHKEIDEFNTKNLDSICRVNIIPLLQRTLLRLKPLEIINGFLDAGLFPLNPDKINYLQCSISNGDEVLTESCDEALKEEEQIRLQEEQQTKYQELLAILEKELGHEKTLKCRIGEKLDSDDWHAVYNVIKNKAHWRPKKIRKLYLPFQREHKLSVAMKYVACSKNESIS